MRDMRKIWVEMCRRNFYSNNYFLILLNVSGVMPK